MHKSCCSIALLFLLAAPAQAFLGKCLLEVNNTPYLLGSCEVSIEAGGSFQVSSGKRITYFATVRVDGSQAEGFWNEERGANHAHTPLGVLKRNGACWINETAKVCAWR